MTHHETLLANLDVAVDNVTDALHACEDAEVDAKLVSKRTASLLMWLRVHEAVDLIADGETQP